MTSSQQFEDPPSYIDDAIDFSPDEREDPMSTAQDLPRYITGTTVEVAACNTKSIYEPVIQVDVDPNPTRSSTLSVDVGDVITGKVNITPQKDMEFCYLFIDLVGEEISLRDKGYSESHYKRVFSLAKYDIPRQNFPGKTLEKGFKYSFTYSLVVPETIPHELCPCGGHQHDQLPPSYGRPLEQPIPDGDSESVSERCARILYKVRARLYKPVTSADESPKVWAQGKRTLSIRPTAYLPPNLEQLKDKNGHSLRLPVYSSKKKLSQGLIRKVDVGTVELRTSQPLNIYLNNPATSLVSLDVIYTPPYNKTTPNSPLEIDHVSYKVDALTFAATQAMIDPPSRQSVMNEKKKSSIHMGVDTLLRQNLTICKPLWRLNEDNNDVNNNSYVTTLALPFSFPVSNKKVVSTYFSCLTSRQYELTVSVNFGSSIGSHCITVPVLVSNYRPRQLSISSSMYDSEFTPIRSDGSSYFNYSIPTYQESLGSSASSTSVVTPPSRGHNFTWGGGARRIARTCEQAAIIIASI